MCVLRDNPHFLHSAGVNITLVDKNSRTVFDVLDQYPTKRSQDIKDIIVRTSQTTDRQLSSAMDDDGSHDDDGITSVNNPVYDSAVNALGEEGIEMLRIPLSERLGHLPKQMVCAVARVDYHDSIHSNALRLRVGDRIRVIGQNSNGTWVGLLGGAEGSFFASHVDFYEGEWGREGRGGEGSTGGCRCWGVRICCWEHLTVFQQPATASTASNSLPTVRKLFRGRSSRRGHRPLSPKLQFCSAVQKVLRAKVYNWSLCSELTHLVHSVTLLMLSCQWGWPLEVCCPWLVSCILALQW